MFPFSLLDASMELPREKPIDVVGLVWEVNRLPLGRVYAAWEVDACGYSIETGAEDLKVRSWIRRFKSHNFTMPSASPVAKNSLCLENWTPPLTGTVFD